VQLLLRQGVAVEQLSALIGRGQHVVLEYVTIAREYYPALFVKTETTQAKV
jgi:hypothetical protein